VNNGQTITSSSRLIQTVTANL